jgi:hypothetical protein
MRPEELPGSLRPADYSGVELTSGCDNAARTINQRERL